MFFSELKGRTGRKDLDVHGKHPNPCNNVLHKKSNVVVFQRGPDSIGHSGKDNCYVT